jgi:hypothetical protein
MAAPIRYFYSGLSPQVGGRDTRIHGRSQAHPPWASLATDTPSGGLFVCVGCEID